MLNEFKEFEEYIGPFDKASDSHRLNKTDLLDTTDKDKSKFTFGGVPRALRIIVRYAYYKKNMSIDAVNHLLKLWCGFEEDASLFNIDSMDDFKGVTNWLPDYIKYINPDKSNAALEDLNTRQKKNWMRDAFQDSGNINDANSVYFERIIADAIEEGELKEYFLVLDKDPMYKYSTINGNSKKQDVKFLYSRGLKLVAAFILNQIEESLYARSNNVDFANWVQIGCASRNKFHRVISSYTYNIGDKDSSIPIFDVEYLIEGEKDDKPVIKINEKWNELFNPRLVTADELSELSPDVYVFEDMKSGKPLGQKSSW